MRSVLTNVVGPREALELKVDERILDEHGEVLLLCSDGLHTAVSATPKSAAILSGEWDALAMAEAADRRGAGGAGQRQHHRAGRSVYALEPRSGCGSISLVTY